MLSKITRMNPGLFRAATLLSRQQNARMFSTTSVTSTEQAEEKSMAERTVEEQMALVGADGEFSQNKHGYVLAFPWNFDEIITNMESNYRPMSTSSYWHKFMVNSRAIVDFNNLFREFHQACAIPDP